MENTSSSKSKWLGIIGIPVIILIIVSLWASSSYNSLVASNIAVDTQWSQVENQYQRRLDLIPNLVASVQGIMKQEQAIFINIAEARKGYAGARTSDEKVQAANQVESALGRLLVITENYPQLKSNEQFSALMAELSGTENRVAVERGRFNDAVSSYNIKVKVFPGKLLASMFGFHERSLFKASVGAESAPKVNFSN